MGDTATTRWQVTPDLPLRPAAFYRTLNPVEIAMHLMRTWSPLGTRAFMLIVAWGIWGFAAPDLTKAESFAVGWMAQIWIRNIVLVAVIAGALHWWLWIRMAQQDHRYETGRWARTSASSSSTIR